MLNQILENHHLANPAPVGQMVVSVVESEDARPELIAKFLARHNSPMTPYDD